MRGTRSNRRTKRKMLADAPAPSATVDSGSPANIKLIFKPELLALLHVSLFLDLWLDARWQVSVAPCHRPHRHWTPDRVVRERNPGMAGVAPAASDQVVVIVSIGRERRR